MPECVISRAKEILAELVSGGGMQTSRGITADNSDYKDDEMQVSMEDGVAAELLEELKNIELDALTPIESMNILYKLKQKALMG